jgi:hypothetical protein
MSEDQRQRVTLVALTALLAAAVVFAWESGARAGVAPPLRAGAIAAALTGGWLCGDIAEWWPT